MVQAVPEQYGTVTPYLIVPDGHNALNFYEQAFDAMELFSMAVPDGAVMAAEMKIGDSIIMLSGECPGMETIRPQEGQWPPAVIHLYVEDAEAAFKKAVDAGCKVGRELQDMFWGDRFGQVIDPFQQHWSIAQHIEDVPQDVMAERQKEFMEQMAAEHAGQSA